MTQEHPITPPPELVKQWATANGTVYKDLSVFCQNIANEAARWGADQELEACCEWLRNAMNHGLDYDIGQSLAVKLLTARRPKPPSLKEQALEALKNIDDACESEGFSRSDDTDIIRRALISLPD